MRIRGVGIAIASAASVMALALVTLPTTVAPEQTAPPQTSSSDEIVDVSAVQAATVAGPTLVVASWNVCKVACPAPAPSWDVRRERVSRVIAETGADLLGLQEATNNPTAHAKTQAEDIANLVARAGYRTPRVDQADNECRRPRNASGQLTGASPCDNTAMLLYKAATVSEFAPPTGSAAGIVMTGSIAPGMDAASASRSVAWAYLAPAAGGSPFLAVSLHADNAKTAEGEASRVALGQALGPWADAWNAAHGMPGAPVVLMADLNSYDKRQPSGAQAVLRNSGWTDAYVAPTKRNVQYSTINYNPLLPLAEQGFPTKPYEFRTSRKNPVLNATRIDYVMTRGGVQPLDYEVVIRLNAQGRFVPEYQASDHQMVRTTLAFPTS